ncbi:MAG: hypothetical protein P8I30_06320 [Flavobacteriaceae bacterium]|nr:hypothetical protein [Flavobacteriaceae bacterium]
MFPKPHFDPHTTDQIGETLHGVFYAYTLLIPVYSPINARCMAAAVAVSATTSPCLLIY